MIQSDEACSKHTDLQSLKAFIRRLPGMTEEWETGFTYGDGEQYYMEVDLEFADQEGNSNRWVVLEQGIVNRISAHIPAAHLDQDTVDGTPYAAVLVQIAQHLGWHTLDLQTGTYLEANAKNSPI